MEVVEAVYKRMSVRQFTNEPVSDDVIRQLLTDASRAPSGGNVQPWRIYVVNGESLTRMREFLATKPPVEEPEYLIYPEQLSEPYRTARFELGEQMYATLGIAREDKAGRRRQFANNNDFFSAPAAIFCYVDRQMNAPQWSDLGMFLQTFMLLAVDKGLGTCAQEYWSVRHGAVTEFVGAPENEMLFCGVALGHVDNSAPVNSLQSQRFSVDEFAKFV
jgi:nitroreductase